MKVTYNITQNKFNAILNQETTEIKVKFQTGYYPLPVGGGGVVDTSNLVPYTGANKDVNIASNYFKTSKGFDYTYDNDNYFRAIKIDNNYSILDFKSKDESEDNFGIIELIVTPEAGLEIIKKDNNDLSLNFFSVKNLETHSLKPFVSESGFKTPTGTATQALTANGGVFDLNTKLEKGSYPGNAGDLKTEIDGKANTSHTHNISDVTNLQTSLDNKQDKLNSVSGNVGIGILPLSEKLEVGGKVLATGFKIANGTRNQALTADGYTFNLNTKADLEGGKVPATQLPSYVDDVLEFANLASFPATGESGKIYIAIDTNLTYRWGGSSYVVMSSSLALGETSSTAYRGDRGKIAYDHSQATGNPHNTKVEELSDVSGTDTTIVDTDEILKKETAGLWKKLSWANVKSTLKAYFDSIYAPKAFTVKVTTPSSYVTGTLAETEVLRIEIPANSLSDSDVLRIPFLMINKLGTNGTIQIRGKMSTSQTMPSGITDQIFQTAIVAATNQYVGLDRSFIIDDGKLKGFPAGNTSYGNSAISSNTISQKPFDRTVTNYLYISVTLGNTSDQARLEGMQLTNS